MTNDIRKHIMLIESIILDESFKDAQAKFSTTANPDEVKSYIDKFKELSKRNIIKGQDKDIGFWIKGDWDSFKKFVDSNSYVVTKSQSKAIQKKDSIVVYKDEEKQVVIPLTKEASIQYGKNTAWCTAYTDAPNQFIKYFYINKITLFYVLFKDGNKYACAFHPEHADTIECFDKADKSMMFGEFKEETGISKKDIQNWYNSNKTKIDDSRVLNNVSEEVQIAVVTQDGRAIEHIDNPSEEVQLAVLIRAGFPIKHIIDKGIVPSEAVQLAAVNKDGHAIEYIIEKGIIPSEEVQLAAVNKSVLAIQHIDNPSEKVQLAAVNQNGHAFRYIAKGIVPSEQVQLSAVKRNGMAIRNIIEKGIIPSEEVQLAAVKDSGDAIQLLVDNGIVPSEQVQLAAVKDYSDAIKFIDSPSEQVQLAAVNKNGFAIRYIVNPSEEVQLAAVNQTYMAIDDIDNPSEEVQLAAVKDSGDAIQLLVDNGIVPSNEVKALYMKLWGR